MDLSEKRVPPKNPGVDQFPNIAIMASLWDMLSQANSLALWKLTGAKRRSEPTTSLQNGCSISIFLHPFPFHFLCSRWVGVKSIYIFYIPKLEKFFFIYPKIGSNVIISFYILKLDKIGFFDTEIHHWWSPMVCIDKPLRRDPLPPQQLSSQWSHSAGFVSSIHGSEEKCKECCILQWTELSSHKMLFQNDFRLQAVKDALQADWKGCILLWQHSCAANFRRLILSFSKRRVVKSGRVLANSSAIPCAQWTAFDLDISKQKKQTYTE